MGPLEARVLRGLDGALEAALARALDGAPKATVLFSGGVDSSVLALAAAAHGPVLLRTVGGPDSRDLRAAERAAAGLGLPWVGREVTEPEVAKVLHRHQLATLLEPRRSVLAAFALALSDEGAEPWLAGQGADELFGGYAHYRGLSETEFRRVQAEDWRRLVVEDWPWTRRIAETLGHRIVAPFLDPEFAELARQFGSPGPLQGEPTKPALRAWGEARGVPATIARAPKRAFQYGAGIAPMVRRVTRA